MALPEPKSRKEQYLAKSAGMDVEIPAEPKSREEQYLNAIAEGGGGGGGYVLPIASADTLGGVKIGENLSIDANGILSALGGSAAKEITTADYNYPEGNPDRIDLSTLDDGVYYSNIPSGMVWQFNGMGSAWNTPCSFIKIGDALIHKSDGDSRIFYLSGYSDVVMITTSQVANNLTTNSSIQALSAKQGKILNEKIATDLTNVPDDTTVSGTTGLKIWDMPAGHYFINGTDRNIFWTVSVTDVLEGVQGTFDIVRFTYNNHEYATIKFFGSMGNTDFMEAWVTVSLSNGARQGLTQMVTTETF